MFLFFQYKKLCHPRKDVDNALFTACRMINPHNQTFALLRGQGQAVQYFPSQLEQSRLSDYYKISSIKIKRL